MLPMPLDRTTPRGEGMASMTRLMMRLDPHGGRVFTLEAPHATVAEVTIDFGGGAIRTLAMHRDGDGARWTLRLHPGLPCVRYRFRVDGRTVLPPEADTGTDAETAEDDGWQAIRPAA